MKKHRSRKRILYALGGAILGLGAPVGALLLRWMSGHRPTEELQQFGFFYGYELFGTCVVFAVAGYFAGRRVDQLADDRERLIDVTQHDELTGLLNTRAFWQRYRRATEADDRLALLMIDVDKFKKINDERGHRFGDEALRHVAKALVAATRAGDDVARWGGDEFVVLMRGASEEVATTIAARIRQRVSSEPARLGNLTHPVSVTIGIAISDGRATADGLFDRADRALYVGKNQGRDQAQLSKE